MKIEELREEKKMKRLLAVLLAFVMIFGVTACGGGQGEGDGGGQDVKTLKFAHWYAEDHPQHKAISKFKELIEEKSGGTVKVEIYPNSQLGSEDTYIDSVKQGTVQMGATGTMIAKYLPKIYAIETPFLFSGWDDAREVLTGETKEILTDGFVEASGMRIAAITVNGFRQFSSNKDLSSMEAFKGQRIRVPNVPHYLKMIEALGGSPIAMSLTEVFTALEQKAVDGQDNPYPTVQTSSLYEVQKNMLESNHMFSPAVWVVNEAFYEGLSDEQKTAFDESIAEAEAYNWDISKAANDEAKQFILDQGVNVIQPDDAFVQQLRDSQKSVYDWYFAEIEGSQEFIEAVWAFQGSL